MTDKIDATRRSANMRAIRSKDMTPEIGVRKLIHGMGYRFRLHRKDLPGKPDLVFPGLRKIIFVHGCFWHQHDDPQCKDGRLPESRKEYWIPKLRRNQERDIESQEKLENMGWGVMIVWECESKKEKAIERIIEFLKRGRP